MPKTKIAPLDAKRFLGEISPAWKAFWFHNGPVVRSLPQLAEVLPKVTANMFSHHVTPAKHDLAVWVKDVIGDLQFAQEMAKEKTQAGLTALIAARVKELQGSLAVAPKAAKKK